MEIEMEEWKDWADCAQRELEHKLERMREEKEKVDNYLMAIEVTRRLTSENEKQAPAKENNTAAYIRHVSDYTGIGPDRVLASPQERPTDWLLIGYAMAVVENGKPLPAVPMLKGFSLAMSQ